MIEGKHEIQTRSISGDAKTPEGGFPRSLKGAQRARCDRNDGSNVYKSSIVTRRCSILLIFQDSPQARVAAATEHFVSAFPFSKGSWQIDNNIQS